MGKIVRWVNGEYQGVALGGVERSLSPLPDDMSERIYEVVEPFTVTGPVRTAALIAAVKYVIEEDIPGDFVECGVWRGGAIMAMALTLLEIGAERRMWLYDTFEGMPPPQDIDGKKAWKRWVEEDGDWCRCPIEEVTRNVYGIGYPYRLFQFVRGPVEDTIPRIMPKEIALLRLDTDWYQSTKHELVHLFPRLSSGGVLLIDDYGHWWGARKAVKEYIAENELDIYLERIDKAARITIKGGR